MNVIIVHGTNERDLERIKEQKLLPQNERHWIPWLKEKLEEKGIKTFTPLMPRNWQPRYLDWKEYLEQFLIDEDTILVGHSAGAGFLVRWLGEINQKIKKLILIAPAIIHEGNFPPLKDLLDFEINPKIKDNVKEIVIFVSDNEGESIKKSVEIYYKKLKSKLIELKDKGHFLEKHMGAQEFLELLEEILN